MYTMDPVSPSNIRKNNSNNIIDSSRTDSNIVVRDDIDSDSNDVIANDEDVLHTKPLDVAFLPQGKDSSQHQESRANSGTGLGVHRNVSRVDSAGSSSSKEATEPDMIRHNSLSDVLLSPSPSKTQADKHKQFFRAQSEPPTERTPLTSSSSENSEHSDSSKRMEYNSINRARSTDDSIMKRQESDEIENDNGQSKMRNKFRNLASFATLTNWWKKNIDQKKIKREKIEERKMRLKLQYHFMSPFEKYKLGRKPWKLGVQILKILIVTTQVKVLKNFKIHYFDIESIFLYNLTILYIMHVVHSHLNIIYIYYINKL